jgi:hypothetical protein
VYADRQRRIAERATGWAEQIDGSALARQTLHRAESGAVLASTGADAEPCSVLDSPHLPAALGFFKLFARPFCPELGERGYQYDLRRTLAKVSS